MTSSIPVKVSCLGCIVAGVVVFGVAAAFLSALALLGIALAAFGAISFTWISLGGRLVLTGLICAAVGSTASWVAMRSMMRWVAVSSGLTPILTLEGTLSILGTSLLMSLLPGMGYVHFRRKYGPSFRTSLGYGIILTLAGGLPVIILVSSEISSIAREPIIPVSFLLGVPILFSLVLEGTHRFLATRTLLAGT